MAHRIVHAHTAYPSLPLPQKRPFRFVSAASVHLVALRILKLECFTPYSLLQGTERLGITYDIAPRLNPFGFIFGLQKTTFPSSLKFLPMWRFSCRSALSPRTFGVDNLLWNIVGNRPRMAHSRRSGARAPPGLLAEDGDIDRRKPRIRTSLHGAMARVLLLGIAAVSST